MLSNAARVSVLWLLVAALGASVPPVFADGTVEGLSLIEKVKGRGAPYFLWYEYNVFLTPDGEGAQALHVRTPFRQAYFVDVPAGRYSLLSTQPQFFGRERVVPAITVVDGQTTRIYAETPADYAMLFYDSSEWGASPWEWGSDFYQTFVATGTSIIRVSTRVAGGAPTLYRLSIHRVVGETPAQWPEAAPNASRTSPSAGDIWAGWRAGEVPTVPGQAYALRVRDAAGSGSFGVYQRTEDGSGYAGGRAWRDGQPMNFDIYGTVCSDNDGTVLTQGKGTHGLGSTTSWHSEWGQTYRARGSSLAGVSLFASGGSPPYQSAWQWFAHVTVFAGGPGGPQVGVMKKTLAGYQAANTGIGGTSYNEGEVPTTPGEVYFIQFASWGMNPFRFDSVVDYIPDGQAYQAAVAQNYDLNMQIVEYASSEPTPTPTPPAEPAAIAVY